MATKRRVSLKVWLILIVATIVSATVLVGFVAKKLLSLKMGAVHTITLPSPPRFLTDSLALVTAKQAMENEGYNTKIWQPIEARKTSDPDGNHDKFLARSSADSNGGTILFANSPQGSAKHSRVVRVELKANRVECRVETPE